MIYIIRDPRDQVQDIIENNHLRRYSNPGTLLFYGDSRVGLINQHVDIIKKRYQKAIDEYKRHPRQSVFIISFEDLVFNAVQYIDFFLSNLNLGSFEWGKTNFKPEISARNVGIYKRGLSKYESELIGRELMPLYSHLTKLYSPF